MVRGRKPKPPELHVMDGTYRPDRHGPRPAKPTNCPELPDDLVDVEAGETPSCPTFLDEAAQLEWLRVVAELQAVGMVHALDRSLLAAHCQLWSRYTAAELHLAEEGAVLTLETGRRIVNPWLGISLRCLKELRSHAAELGLSAVSRARLHVKPPQTPNAFDLDMAKM